MKTRNFLASLGIFLLLFTSTIQFQSCQGLFNDDPPKIDTFYLDQEFLDYTYLKPGHYWVYQNIETGEIDSTYAILHSVLKGELSRFEKPGGGGTLIERTRLEHRYIDYQLRGKEHYGHWYLGDDPTTELHFDMSIFSLKIADENVGGITAQKYHPRPWSAMYLPTIDFYTIFHDSLHLGATTYINVVQVQIAPNWEAAAWIYQSYFVKDIGVVRREFYDGSIWDLIRHGKY